jgi:hypothetical protein
MLKLGNLDFVYVYIMDVLIKVHSYQWVIEKQCILHMLELEIQQNI